MILFGGRDFPTFPRLRCSPAPVRRCRGSDSFARASPSAQRGRRCDVGGAWVELFGGQSDVAEMEGLAGWAIPWLLLGPRVMALNSYE
jgi:hypothetical protein